MAIVFVDPFNRVCYKLIKSSRSALIVFPAFLTSAEKKNGFFKIGRGFFS